MPAPQSGTCGRKVAYCGHGSRGWSLRRCSQRLRDDLGFRRIENGMRTLESVAPGDRDARSRCRNAGVLARPDRAMGGCRVRQPATAREAARAISPRRPRRTAASRLPAPAHGGRRGRHVARKNSTAAIEHFRLVLSFEDEVDDARTARHRQFLDRPLLPQDGPV